MKSLLHWAIEHRAAMNALMLATIVAGAMAMSRLRRERFPEFLPDEIAVSVEFPGASPAKVEEAICQKIEEAVRTIDGVYKTRSVAREGSGEVVMELHRGADRRRALSDVRSAIRQITTFPRDAEKPYVREQIRLRNVLSVAVLGPPSADDDESAQWRLRELAEQVYEDVLSLPAVSYVNMWHAKPYQIDVEVSEATLRKYRQSHGAIAAAIRRANLDTPAGRLSSAGREFRLRGSNEKRTGREIAKLPVLPLEGVASLTVDELGHVRDGFADLEILAQINGRPALSMQIKKTPRDDMFAINEQVRAYAANRAMPPGYELLCWDDYSRTARDRLNLLSRNALTGLLLVFVVLAVFLHLRLAFWVALGIPVSVLGACAVMFFRDATLNMETMFAFVMALGIVVDDAIVIAENVFAHRQQGKPGLQAAIDGTCEVLPSVITSVLTTVIAFIPLAFVSGELGKKIAVMPLVLIAVLVISLLEAAFVLPCHLSHSRLSPRGGLLDSFHARVQGAIQAFIRRVYTPILDWSLAHTPIVISLSLAALLVAAGLVRGGFTPYIHAQRLDWAFLYAYVEYPGGTPAATIDKATQQMETAMLKVAAEYKDTGRPLLRLTYRGVGYTSQLDNLRGEVYAEMDRSHAFGGASSRDVVARWRQRAGEFPGAERAVFWGLNNAAGGRPIELTLTGNDSRRLEQVADAVKARLRDYAGVHDVADDLGQGKWEWQFSLKPTAQDLGFRSEDLFRALRAAYYGEEVMRLQRGRHEVKLMVRYPPDERRSRARLDAIRLQTDDDVEVPLRQLADVTAVRTHAEIHRFNGRRSITLAADVDEDQANAAEIVAHLRDRVLPDLLSAAPGVRANWQGQQEQTRLSLGSLSIGFLIALFGMYALLTLEFRSYLQPLIVLIVIPFGVAGAVFGHFVLSQPFTMYSLFGMVTLSGVVANDSIVLVDFINRRRAEGTPLRDAIRQAGLRRFRPVTITTITTITALLPILLERDTQAQEVIPMAVSLSFGLLCATLWVLVLVPVIYQVYGRWQRS